VQVLGQATYQVTVGQGGEVDVQLTSASDHASTFAGYLPEIRKRIRVPERARRSRFTVALDVRDQYPDGRQPSEVGEVKVTKGQGKFTVGQTAPGERSPTVLIEELPGVGIHVKGKVCSGGVGVFGPTVYLNGGCSLENIGARARRMVSARVTEEIAL
jgi:hypothetical protein